MLEKWKSNPGSRHKSTSVQIQNLINWSLAEGLSFHKISFKYVSNFLRYFADRERERERQTPGITEEDYIEAEGQEAKAL